MPEPSCNDLVASHAELLEERTEWQKTIAEQGAEVERVSRDLAEARAELATMTAVAESNQRAHAIAVQEVQRLRPVFDAAQVWHVVRRDKVSGDVFHQGCKALDEAVRASNGTLGREPVAPPSEEEIERGRELVRRATADSERRNAELFGRKVKESGS